MSTTATAIRPFGIDQEPSVELEVAMEEEAKLHAVRRLRGSWRSETPRAAPATYSVTVTPSSPATKTSTRACNRRPWVLYLRVEAACLSPAAA